MDWSEGQRWDEGMLWRAPLIFFKQSATKKRHIRMLSVCRKLTLPPKNSKLNFTSVTINLKGSFIFSFSRPYSASVFPCEREVKQNWS